MGKNDTSTDIFYCIINGQLVSKDGSTIDSNLPVVRKIIKKDFLNSEQSFIEYVLDIETAKALPVEIQRSIVKLNEGLDLTKTESAYGSSITAIFREAIDSVNKKTLPFDQSINLEQYIHTQLNTLSGNELQVIELELNCYPIYSCNE